MENDNIYSDELNEPKSSHSNTTPPFSDSHTSDSQGHHGEPLHGNDMWGTHDAQTGTWRFAKPGDLNNVGTAERFLSLLIGAVVLFALRRKIIGYMALMAVSGVLIYRGSSGYCPLYNKLGINTSDEDLSWLKTVGTDIADQVDDLADTVSGSENEHSNDDSSMTGNTTEDAELRNEDDDCVDEATKESFPASDPPSTW